MPKGKLYIIVFFILVSAFLAGNLAYPQFLKLPVVPDIPYKLGLDLQGGVHLLYQADLSSIAGDEKEAAMEGLRDVIERRVNLFGAREPLVQAQGERLIVELAGVHNVSDAIKEIGETPFLEFREPKLNYEEIIEKNQKVNESGQGDFEDPFSPTQLTGRYLKKAELGFDDTTQEPLVLIEFNDEGAKLFEQLTEKNVQKPLAIYIDNILISAPVVQEKISGGKARISGNFNLEEAKKLARNLNAGALPVPINLISQETVGPTLGQISLEKSLRAGIYGFLAILVFLIIFYRLPGFFAALSLLIYVAFILTLFKIVPVTLTLAGIGGFLLSMGMAVDANILIFSRMREELRSGKSYLISLEDGARRAWPAIRDGNLTTILVGLILFAFGTSFVKGFALTLAIGNLVNMFTAIFITNNFLRLLGRTKIEKLSWLFK